MKFSIRLKTSLLITFFSLAIAGSALTTFGIITSKNNEARYKQNTTNVAETVSQLVDIKSFKTLKSDVQSILDTIETKVTSDEWGSDEWNTYSAKFNAIKQTPAYISLMEFATKIDQANGDDIECVNLAYLDPKLELLVYLIDSEEDIESRCPPGCLDTLLDENRNLLNDPSLGFPAFISNTREYGWIVTAGVPIKDGENVIGYALADTTMQRVKENEGNVITRISTYIAIATFLAAAANIVLIHLGVIRPIKRINDVAKAYKHHTPEENHALFNDLKVDTHDELSELALSIKDLENDVYNKINELTAANKKLVESQHVVEEMTELAKRDALTGIRNKVSYDAWVSKTEKRIANNPEYEFGIAMIDLNYLKTINDIYGHNNGNIALQTLSALICRIFSHSPVFRIGGDEFVIIVAGQDFANADLLIKEFNSEIARLSQDESLPPAKRISAALGFAKFDPKTDTGVKSVFERADKLMYEQKHRMKEGE